MSILYDIINILPLSILAVMLFGVFAGMPEGNIWGPVICAVFSLWVIIMRGCSRKNRLRGAGIVAVFFIALLIAAGQENIQNFLKDYFWVIRLIFISAAALAVGILMSRNIRIKRYVTAALLIYCIIATLLGWEMSKEAFALICFIILVRTAEEIQRRWKKSGCPDLKDHITRISPILIAGCLIVYFIPAPDEPYDWQFAKDLYNGTASLINRIYGYITHPSDDYGSIGFSDSGGFLAGLGENDEEVLFITAGNTTIKDFRLVGCISGDFRGREWIFDGGNEECSRMTDTIETSCAVMKYAGALQSEYLQKTDMYYETYLYNTRYIFSPAKIRLEVTKEKTAGISEKNGSIISDQRLNYNDKYLISCYALNYGNPDLRTLLDNAGPIDRTEWEKSANAENVLGKNGFSFEDYQKYREDIYKKYCHSYGLSEKVTEIINDIKNNSVTRYEAARNLEAYLKKMEYSTDCGPLPSSVSDAKSFLDHFLLTSRKGYCMHFATAFVLMANEMGIPCRYVQGYSARRDINSNIVVKQSSAHAWPEVYFDNVGWVAFEPTPGYSVPVGWSTRFGSADDSVKDNSITENDADNEEADDLSTEDQTTAALNPLIFIIPSLAVISFLLLFYIISRSASRKKYKRMSCSDKFRYLTQQNLNFLGLLGFRIASGETLSEFSERIIQSDKDDIKEHLGFIPVYETALYSDREITEDDVNSAENICHALREIVKKSRLRFRLLLLIKKQ